MEDTKYKKILVVIPAYNEKGKIGRAISGIPRDIVGDILVIDDGSSDTTAVEARESGARVISNPRQEGVGSVLRKGIEYALENNYGIIVIMAGNSKDNGGEIPGITEPILKGRYDFIQGSRFLEGGAYSRMPLYRLIATKYVHPLLFSLISGRKITDSTNGFRAVSTALFNDGRLGWRQEWLNRYELEPYIFYKAIKLGYRVREVPVSKTYPPRRLGYTKMRPILDWWSILKPVFLLGLGIKK